jgi:hypothetical protein
VKIKNGIYKGSPSQKVITITAEYDRAIISLPEGTWVVQP